MDCCRSNNCSYENPGMYNGCTQHVNIFPVENFQIYHKESNLHHNNPNAHSQEVSRSIENSAAIFVNDSKAWISSNFEVSKGKTIPRCYMYFAYQNYCFFCGKTPINQASFGKLVRSIFGDVRTRRLGTRGNSRYHYCNLQQREGTLFFRFEYVKNFPSKLSLLEKSTTNIFQSLHVVDSNPSVQKFVFMYKEHLEECLNFIKTSQFDQVFNLWKAFWLGFYTDDTKLDVFNLRPLVEMEFILSFIFQADCKFFQYLLDTLIPALLTPNSKSRDYLKFVSQMKEEVEHVTSLLQNDRLSLIKSSVVSVFTDLFKPRVNVNIFASSAVELVKVGVHLEIMKEAFNSIDLDFVEDQLTWVSSCGKKHISTIRGFVASGLGVFFEQEKWAMWMDEMVEFYWENLGDSCQIVISDFAHFLSLVYREITLRHSSVLWSFHIFSCLLQDHLYWAFKTRMGMRLTELTVKRISSQCGIEDLAGIFDNPLVVNR